MLDVDFENCIYFIDGLRMFIILSVNSGAKSCGHILFLVMLSIRFFLDFIWILPCCVSLAHWPNSYCFLSLFLSYDCAVVRSHCGILGYDRLVDSSVAGDGCLLVGRIVSVHLIAVADAAPAYSRIILYEVNSLYSGTLNCCEPSFMLYMYRTNRLSRWYLCIWQGWQI